MIAKLEGSAFIQFWVLKRIQQQHQRHQLYRALAVLSIVGAAITYSFNPRAQMLSAIHHPAPVKQFSDREPAKVGKLPVAYSDDTVTITFHNCRENDKKHWSCQRVDGTDTEHYVYIPGFQPPTSYPGIGSTK